MGVALPLLLIGHSKFAAFEVEALKPLIGFEDGVVEDGHDVARRQDEQFVPQGRQRQSRARREARTLSFDPIADGRYPFTTGTAWGVATIAGDDVTLDVRGGRLDLASLSLRGRPLPSGAV